MAKAMEETKTGPAIQPRQIDRLTDYLARRATDEGGTRAYDVAASQLDKILVANTDDEIWEADSGGTVGGRDFENVECRWHSFTVHPSGNTMNAPLGHYIIISATVLVDTNDKVLYHPGDDVLVNTGSPLIIGKMRTFEAKGRLPVDGVIRGYDAPAGRVLKLRPLAARPVPVTAAQ